MTNESNATLATESSGVEDLIGRLREQGVDEGRSQADALVEAAKLEAADLVAKAKSEAEQTLEAAKVEAAKLEAGGEEAIRLAMRDTILSMEGELIEAFAERLRRLVGGVLEDRDFLERLILEVARRSVPGEARAEVLLPEALVSLQDLQAEPEAAQAGTLAHFVHALGGDMLREGLSFGVSEAGEAGIRVRLADQDVEIDLTPGAVSELLLAHMLPRYRALLRGSVATSAAATQEAAR